jgi:hypothetical protein
MHGLDPQSRKAKVVCGRMRGLDPQSRKAKVYEIGICLFFASFKAHSTAYHFGFSRLGI